MIDEETLRKRIADLQREANDLIAPLANPLQQIANIQGKIAILSEWLESLRPVEDDGMGKVE